MTRAGAPFLLLPLPVSLLYTYSLPPEQAREEAAAAAARAQLCLQEETEALRMGKGSAEGQLEALQHVVCCVAPKAAA